MTDDSWKGEHLIRKVKSDPKKNEASRVVNCIYHAKRRAKGIPAAAARNHSVFAKTAFKVER